jgi:hypothetical protein
MASYGGGLEKVDGKRRWRIWRSFWRKLRSSVTKDQEVYCYGGQFWEGRGDRKTRTETEVDRRSGSCRSFRSELFWLIFVKEVVSGKQDRQELSEHFWS